jgi:hypothetical protein
LAAPRLPSARQLESFARPTVLLAGMALGGRRSAGPREGVGPATFAGGELARLRSLPQLHHP